MKKVLLTVSVFYCLSAYAQIPQTLDPSFGEDGYSLSFSTSSNQIFANAYVSEDDQIHIAGFINSAGINQMLLMVRGENGQMVDEFGSSSQLQLDPWLGGVSAQAGAIIPVDEKYYVAGTFSPSSTSTKGFLLRLNEDGSLDGTFGSGGLLTITTGVSKDVVFRMKKKGDYLYIVGWQLTGNQDAYIIRLNLDGSIDETFGTFGIALIDNGGVEIVSDFSISESGDIYVTGSSQDTPEDYYYVCRVTSDGDLDYSFGIDGFHTELFANRTMLAIAELDGNVYWVGTIAYAGDNIGVIKKLNEDGFPDLSFSFADGKIYYTTDPDKVFGFTDILFFDEKLLLLGYDFDGTNLNNYLVSFNETGELNSSFGAEGRIKILPPMSSEMFQVQQIEKQNSGDIILAGTTKDDSDHDRYVVLRYSDLPTGISDEPIDQSTIAIYPNPTTSGIVHFQGGDIPQDVTVYDQTGRVVAKKYDRGGISKIQLPEHLVAGQYLVQIGTGEKQIFKKIILSK